MFTLKYSMKFKAFALVTLVAGISSASAFSLDFTGLATDGSVSLSEGDQLVIQVPDFGNVGFGVAPKDASALITEIDGTPVIEFDSSRTITVNFFAGVPVENVMVSFVGVQADTPVYTALTPTSGTISISAGSAGISELSFDQAGDKVPEPSTAILALLGAAALLRRRR